MLMELEVISNPATWSRADLVILQGQIALCCLLVNNTPQGPWNCQGKGKSPWGGEQGGERGGERGGEEGGEGRRDKGQEVKKSPLQAVEESS